MKIEDYRKQIDQIDFQIMNLLMERFKLTDTIGELKRQGKIAVLQNKREQEIYDKISLLPSNSTEITEIYQVIMEKSKQRQKNPQI